MRARATRSVASPGASRATLRSQVAVDRACSTAASPWVSNVASAVSSAASTASRSCSSPTSQPARPCGPAPTNLARSPARARTRSSSGPSSAGGCGRGNPATGATGGGVRPRPAWDQQGPTWAGAPSRRRDDRNGRGPRLRIVPTPRATRTPASTLVVAPQPVEHLYETLPQPTDKHQWSGREGVAAVDVSALESGRVPGLPLLGRPVRPGLLVHRATGLCLQPVVTHGGRGALRLGRLTC